MKRMLICSAAVAVVSLTGLALRAEGAKETAVAVPTKNIVQTAVAAGQFTMLATVLQAAGLVETLESAGPFTVFAPTDEAFKKLPAGTLDALLKDPAKLKAVLLYHVVSGEVLAKDVVKLKSAKSVEGSVLKIATGKGGVMVDGAKVTATDILASNGVIHVIDTVLIPAK
jgi:uncharacterized surface protein with fasciclin (FAS1) repeats